MPKLSLGHVIRDESLKNADNWETYLGKHGCKGPPQALQSLEVPAGLQGHTLRLSPIRVSDGCTPSPLLSLIHKCRQRPCTEC